MQLIKLTNGKTTKVSDQDWFWLNLYTWYDLSGYAVTEYRVAGIPVRISMHRMILSVTDPTVFVDHQDMDKLNNQRENLRLATCKQNNSNRKPKRRYKGVYKTGKGYRAMCKQEGKIYQSKTLMCEKEAAMWYNQKAKELFGEFARLNEL